jgi:hypothetical protein
MGLHDDGDGPQQGNFQGNDNDDKFGAQTAPETLERAQRQVA